jgi:hypothetical protein
VRDAQVVFESVPEIVERKIEVLREIEAASLPDSVIASNTSSIMIGELGRALVNVERLVGTHWFYPSNVMPLVEVARADQSAPWAVDLIVGYLGAIGKKPVVVRDSPGFFMTRFVNLFAAEAMRAVQEGICTIRDVDEMVKAGLAGRWAFSSCSTRRRPSTPGTTHRSTSRDARRALRDPSALRAGYSRPATAGAQPEARSRGGWYDYYGIDPK